MNIKMIATDLDGTLLRSDKTISAYTQDVLRRCRAAGIRVVYATGRGYSAEVLADGTLFDGKIIMNGTLARIGEEIICYHMMPRAVAYQIVTACDARGMNITWVYGDVKYSNFAKPAAWTHVPDFQPTDFSQLHVDADELFILNPTQEEQDFIAQLLPEDLYAVTTGGAEPMLQIMHKQATKSQSIDRLARRWGISPAEIAAFGDDMNDIDMLTYAGQGIAMGNAPDAVKAVSNHLCKSNDEDGVAHWLEENVLAG